MLAHWTAGLGERAEDDGGKSPGLGTSRKTLLSNMCLSASHRHSTRERLPFKRGTRTFNCCRRHLWRTVFRDESIDDVECWWLSELASHSTGGRTKASRRRKLAGLSARSSPQLFFFSSIIIGVNRYLMIACERLAESTHTCFRPNGNSLKMMMMASSRKKKKKNKTLGGLWVGRRESLTPIVRRAKVTARLLGAH